MTRTNFKIFLFFIFLSPLWWLPSISSHRSVDSGVLPKWPSPVLLPAVGWSCWAEQSCRRWMLILETEPEINGFSDAKVLYLFAQVKQPLTNKDITAKQESWRLGEKMTLNTLTVTLGCSCPVTSFNNILSMPYKQQWQSGKMQLILDSAFRMFTTLSFQH